ncbi:hypothetical protein DB44_HF00020 [Candidatus Protochlamydia amoebophila]|uniref:Uncharacterized protein n=1 Tax=Candidatus Protochlamydia amoebophila TaxID=362787 RepID=A0A0C1H6X7_9BACT|nr:hypothetical protein DB44_HF00020 [Candidatus Protochlamydia amoebophila]
MHGVYVGVTTTTITRVHLYQLESTNTTTRERAQVQPMSSFIEGFGIQHVQIVMLYKMRAQVTTVDNGLWL